MARPIRGSNYTGINIAVEYVATDLLQFGPRRLRRRSVRQLRKLADSISDFGFLVPVLVDEQLRIMAGEGRVDAARLLKLSSVPVIRIEHLTEAQRRLFAIADNETPRGVEFIPGALTLELKEIQLLEPQVELTTSGLSIARIDGLFGRTRTDELAEKDDKVVPLNSMAVSRLDDVWQLGRHVLACGDARDRGLLAALVDERRVQMLLTDGLSNLDAESADSGAHRRNVRDPIVRRDEMSRTFLTDAIAAACGVLRDGALAYVFTDWSNLDALTEAAIGEGLAQKNLLVWCKDNAEPGAFYRSQHELVAVYKIGTAPHTNNVNLRNERRNRSDCFFYPVVKKVAREQASSRAACPTLKPVGLLADLILDVTKPGDLVMDPFGGSGSTLIAAERTDRTCIMLELEPVSVDSIIRRFEARTGIEAIHQASGLTFAEMVAEHQSISQSILETADGR